MDPSPLRDALTVAAGVLTGILSGAFGVGGAVISTPFVRGLGASATIAIGTTLPSVIPSSISGSLRYSREQLIAWTAVAWVVPIGVLCAIGGALATEIIPGDGHLQQLVTAGFVAFTAWRTYAVGRGPRRLVVDESRHAGDICRTASDRRGFVGIGAISGALSGLLGVGGGIVMVPAFNQWMKMTLKQSIATSLVCVGLFAIPGTITHAALGNIDWRFAFFLTLGVVPGARIGSALTLHAGDVRLRNAVALFLTVVAVVYGVGEIAALFG
ncbi:MAG: sulfite exporter TauE/SafE family protein [Actinobacteria bacterium]|nr:MAG: sulfite exporter TauE/SafE family protein [Actinomycetota bacterium]